MLGDGTPVTLRCEPPAVRFHRSRVLLKKITGMFNFLKSTESLEAALREWALEDCMRLMDASERSEWERYYADRQILELAEEVAAKCVSELHSAEMFMKLNGTVPNLRDNWRYTKGAQLVRDIAKRRCWKVEFEGSAAFGFRCKIS